MLRKPGGYRKPTDEQRKGSMLSKEEHAKWFRSFWSDVTGESTRHRPAPFPVEVGYRLVRMFSFVGDTVLDPFMSTASTLVAACRCDRNSMGVEIEPEYFRQAKARMEAEVATLIDSRHAIAIS